MRKAEFCGRALVSWSSPFCVFCACTLFSPAAVFFFPYFENEVLDFFHEMPCRGAYSIINDLPFLYTHCTSNLFSAFLVILFVILPIFPSFVARVQSSRWSWTPRPRSTDKSCYKVFLHHPDIYEKCHVASCVVLKNTNLCRVFS